MKYQPVTSVWEVTMGCNMRCKHCGSSCAEPLPDELDTQEALEVCDQCADIGLRWITLSGGEPLTRKDTPLLVKRLHERGVSVNMITNGWLLGETLAQELKDSGIATIAISIDGTEEIHDSIRREGSFARDEAAFEILGRLGITTGAVTTISKKNIDNLPALKEKLISMGVKTWQVQLGLPMGNFKERLDWVLEPEQVNSIIDFCYDTAIEDRIKIYPADCIGYYTKKEMEIKKMAYGTDQVSLWDGCNAGKRSFGILHNGDVLGCTSIRSKEYIEGNLRERSLKDMWNDEQNFTTFRELKKEQLESECSICTYGNKCLGGCPNTRLTMNGSIYSENQYCSYNQMLKQWRKKFEEEADGNKLYAMAMNMVKAGNYQNAAYALQRVIELIPDHLDAYKAKAFCEYMCGNYNLCKETNEKALEINSEDAYALKGLGIALYKLSNVEEGIKHLKRAADLTNYEDEDILNDLRVVAKSM